MFPVRVEVLTVVTMKSAIFCDVTSCSLVSLPKCSTTYIFPVTSSASCRD